MGNRYTRGVTGSLDSFENEDYYLEYCFDCNQKTEHEVTEGCLACVNRATRRQAKMRKIKRSK